MAIYNECECEESYGCLALWFIILAIIFAITVYKIFVRVDELDNRLRAVEIYATLPDQCE